MTDRRFVHLHCHSHYSLLDGAGSIDKLVDRAKEHGMNALAITDHGNLHGAVEFYTKCKKAGINPILGMEAYIAPGSRFEKEAGSMKEASYHLTLLAQNRTGFKNLIKMASAAMLEGFYFKPRIDKELLKQYHEGIICLSGCVSSEFSRALLRGSAEEDHFKEAVDIAHWFQNLFGDRYFLEIMNNGVEIQRLQLQAAVDVAKRVGIPLVATSDTHYVDPEDAEAQDVMLCINTGKFRTDTNRMRMDGNQYFLRSPEQMYECFPGLEDAVALSQQIADSVSIDLELGKRNFPTYSIPNSRTPDEYLRELCELGLKERYAGDEEMLPGGELSERVMKRLNRELSCISKLGFSNYFLIVWDFVRYARERNIPATARGSGVGALVCYALYLSHVCPLRYDLLFERFLDENRREAPDIDIDFCKDRRSEVIRYVKDKYGEANVAQIGTFGTLAARAAIKDVGRVLGMPLDRVNKVTGMVPEELGIELDDAIQKSDELNKAYNSDPEIRELLDLARKIEGLARNIGTHAAAVVIADKPLTEYVPLGRVTGKQDIITQWSMGDVEAAGLLKMDFLGLRNLTILSRAVDLIEQTTGKRVDPYKFPIDDRPTYALLQRGETKGIFQLESGGIRDLLQKMRPDKFADIIATNALYRPGPLEGGMVRDYVEVKHGRQRAEYIHPICEKILSETNGVMVYQEQVMRILNELGGIELANAYTCIKAISKKKEEIIAKNKEQFLKGASEKGLTTQQAEDFWNLIIKFAGYGFNKCVVGSTEIFHAKTGERTTVEDLFQRRRPFAIHALGDDGRLQARKVTDVVWNGRRRVYELTTRLGHRITATSNHPFRTFNGWTNLGELKLGDRIAAPRELKVPARKSWPEHEIVTLGHLLAEGNTCHPTCLYFFNDCRAAIDDFRDAVEQFPDTVGRVDQRADGKRWEVCVSTGRDMKFLPGQTPWNATRPVAVAEPQRRHVDIRSKTNTAVGASRTQPQSPGSAKVRCGAFQWAERIGLLGLKATEKKIPAEVFSLSDDNIALLLGRLWTGDGFFGGQQTPYYATSSLRLARDVRQLLLRLGIVGRIYTKNFKYRYRGEVRDRAGYTVHLIGEDSMSNFVDRVLPHVIGRERDVAWLRDYVASNAPGRSTRDTIPFEVRDLVDQQRQNAGLTWRDLETQSGVCIRELCRVSKSPGKRGFRRQTIGRLAEFFDSNELRDHASSDICWDEVVAIEPLGIEDTYDLTVEGDHNFVADGLIVHNSHSTAYALIAYMTAYLKAHFPVEFMAALLCGDIEGRNFKTKDSLVEHLEDSERMEIEVVSPSVNTSDVQFAVADGKIYFGLSAIKGCGGSAAEALVKERKKNGPFKDIFDFCERVDASQCPKAAIESLIKAGAFDEMKGTRKQMSTILDRALQSGASALADKKSGQKSLFGGDDDEGDQKKPAVALPDVGEYEEREKLLMEKEVLGYYLSSHPLAQHEKTLAEYCSHTIDRISELPERAEVILGGMLSSLKFSNTKNPKPGAPSKYVMFDLEDMGGTLRCILWPDDFVNHGHLVQADAILVVRGSIDRRGGDEANLIVNELIPLEELGQRYTTGLMLRVDEEKHGSEILPRIREVIRGYPGNRDFEMLLTLRDGSRVKLKSSRVKLDITPELQRRLDELLGPGNFRRITTPPKANPNGGGRGGGGKFGGGYQKSNR